MKGQFVLLDVKGSTIHCTDRSGKPAEFEVKEPWNQFLPYLEKLDILYIEAQNGIIGEDDALVIEPHFLVAVTGVIDAISCPRKVYVRTMGAEKVVDVDLLRRMTQGNLIHDVFSYKIARRMEIDEAIELAIEDNKLSLFVIDTDEEEARTYLQRDAGAMEGVEAHGLTELDCQNWNYGLHGKFDGVADNRLIELKSSRIPTGTPWPNHNIQMNIYLQMIEELGQHLGMVLYVNEGQMGMALPTKWPRNKTVIGRNFAYLVQTGRMVPDVLRGDAAKECRNCYVKDGCWKLCAGMETQRDCDKCPQAPLCTKSPWEGSSQAYFHHFTRALLDEEKEGQAELYSYSRIASHDDVVRDQLIKDGYAIIGEKKIEEWESGNRGKVITKYRQRSEMPRFRKGDLAMGYDLSQPHDTVTLFYSINIVDLDSETVTVASVNHLPDQLGIVPSRYTSGMRGGRKAIFYAVETKSPLVKIIIDSFAQGAVDLPPLNNFQSQMMEQIFEYNSYQKEAIVNALATPDFYLIQGPAGTGKTSVIVELVNQISKRGQKVLCAAYTNMAVDSIGEKLKRNGIDFLRLGNDLSINENLRDHSPLRKEDLFKTMLEKKDPVVVLSTTTTIGNDLYEQVLFDYVILDEAAQMTEPDAIRPILRGVKAILVGDHAQLQPIVTSVKAQEANLHISLFERLVKTFPNRFTQLREQYRMNDQILEFPNHHFYEGKLKSANEAIASQTLDNFKGDLIDNTPYQVISIDQPNRNDLLQANKGEILATLFCIRDLVEGGVAVQDIGIVAPFRAQVAMLRSILPYPEIQIDTVDRYQGSEKEVILLSTVTSHQVPLLTDEKRINVALTRAKKKMIVLVTNPKFDEPRTFVDLIAKDATNRGLSRRISIEKLQSIGMETASKWQTIIFDHAKKGNAPPIPPFLFIQDELFTEDTQFHPPSKIYFGTIQLELRKPSSQSACIICFQMVNLGIECPGCQYWYHEEHLVTWIIKTSSCPVCKHSLVIEN